MSLEHLRTQQGDEGEIIAESPYRRLTVTRIPAHEQFRVNIGRAHLSILENEIGSSFKDSYQHTTKRGKLSVWQEQRFQDWRIRIEVDKTPRRSAFHTSMARCYELVHVPPRWISSTLIGMVLLRSGFLRCRGREILWLMGKVFSPAAWIDWSRRTKRGLQYLFPFQSQGILAVISIPFDKEKSAELIVLARSKPELSEIWDLQIPDDFLSAEGLRDQNSHLAILQQEEISTRDTTERRTRWEGVIKHFAFCFLVTLLWPTLFTLCVALFMFLPLTLPLLIAHTLVVMVSWLSLPLSIMCALVGGNRTRK